MLQIVARVVISPTKWWLSFFSWQGWNSIWNHLHCLKITNKSGRRANLDIWKLDLTHRINSRFVVSILELHRDQGYGWNLSLVNCLTYIKLSKNYFIVHHKQFMLSARHFLDKYFHFGNKCYYVKIWFKSARRVKQTCLAFRAAFFHCCKYISSVSKTLSANCVLICYSSINVARIHVFHYYINL